VGDEAGREDGVQVGTLGAALVLQAVMAGPGGTGQSSGGQSGGGQARRPAPALAIWHVFPSCAAEFVVIIVSGH
jgi:hypothetical protein